MGPLAHTLALLAMTVATTANEVVPLDMAQNSFDDQYQGCGPAMTAELPALNRSKLQENRVFARVWAEAVAEWQRRGSPVFPLSSPAQAIALMAYTMDGLHDMFNKAMHEAGRSPQEYRKNFHYKTLHFLLTDALATLRHALALMVRCQDVFQEVCGVRFEAQRGQSVRFGEFRPMSSVKPTGQCSGKKTLFQVQTCHGIGMAMFSKDPRNWNVLIPPFETFEVTQVTQEGDKTQIQLRSSGTYSKYNCEWLTGGSIPRSPFHLRGLLLATTALAMATRIL